MIEWIGPPLHTLDELDAFDAMRAFLEAYWGRGGKQSDDIAVLLGSLNRGEGGNNPPLDPAQWSDWRRAVEHVRSEGDERDAEDMWQDASMDAVYRCGLALRELHQTNPWPEVPLLPRAINHLMTELWDHGFSQSEIRSAFEDAVADMPRYAAGDERRP